MSFAWRTVLYAMKKSSVILVNVKSLPEKRRREIRHRLFLAWKDGVKAYSAAKKLRIHARNVHLLYRRFETEGEGAVEEKRRGPAQSPRSVLTPKERDKLASAISGGSPRQLVLGFALWSSRAVVAYARKKFGKSMARRTARRILQRMGFTYQCPVRRAREQNPAAVAEWLEKEYPAIRRLAKEKQAEIFWEDEATCQASTVKACGYSPRGTAPVLRIPANRDIRCNYAAAVNNRGALFFETFGGTMNADVFKGFVEHLLQDVGKPVVLIADNLRVHHANCLQDWFREQEAAGRLWMRYLPSYSPELNPEEYLNRDVKASAAESAIPKTAEEITANTVQHLEACRQDPETVRRVAFHHPAVAYASKER